VLVIDLPVLSVQFVLLLQLVVLEEAITRDDDRVLVPPVGAHLVDSSRNGLLEDLDSGDDLALGVVPEQDLVVGLSGHGDQVGFLLLVGEIYRHKLFAFILNNGALTLGKGLFLPLLAYVEDIADSSCGSSLADSDRLLLGAQSYSCDAFSAFRALQEDLALVLYVVNNDVVASCVEESVVLD
jgi:hypothetical protein